MSSPTLVALRIAGAAIAFMILQRKLGPLFRMPQRDFGWLTLCSLTGIVGNQFLYVTGLSLTTAINATLLSTVIPVSTLLISVVFGSDRLSLGRIVGILLAAAGVVYLVNPARADFSMQKTIGNLLIVFSSLLYGTYIVISKDLFQRYGALNVITWMFMVGAVVSLPVGAYSLGSEHLQLAGTGVWLAVVFVIMLPTVGAYYLNAWALTKVTPSTVAVYIYLQPLIAFGLAPLLLGESWNSRTIAAAVLIFAGVGVVTRRGRSKAVKEIKKHPDALAH